MDLLVTFLMNLSLFPMLDFVKIGSLFSLVLIHTRFPTQSLLWKSWFFIHFGKGFTYRYSFYVQRIQKALEITLTTGGINHTQIVVAHWEFIIASDTETLDKTTCEWALLSYVGYFSVIALVLAAACIQRRKMRLSMGLVAYIGMCHAGKIMITSGVDVRSATNNS